MCHPEADVEGADAVAMNDRLTIWRTRLRWFVAEFLVIVTGVLVAVALNGFYQRRQDARSEASYLALLSRDIGQTTRQLRRKLPLRRRSCAMGSSPIVRCRLRGARTIPPRRPQL